MERLTMIDGCGNYELARCMDCGLEKAGADLENCGMCEEGWQRALKRLAAYEDTGLEPEDLKKAFNETAILKLAAQALSTTPDHLRDLLQAEQTGGWWCCRARWGMMFGLSENLGRNGVSRKEKWTA